MRRYILHDPFNIYHFEAKDWLHPVHNHTYFEIIFILGGNGVHNINGNRFLYGKGDVFLLGPEDFHSFEIEEETEFCFIRFNESFSKIQMNGDSSGWRAVIETLFSVSSQSRGSIVQDLQEKIKLNQLLNLLELEYQNNSSSHYHLIRDSLMQSIMIILARNLRQLGQSGNSQVSNDSAEAILRYLKKNIYNPSRLGIEHLAEQFHMAPAYVSIFFKKHTGVSIKQFVTKHKMSLIEARLIYSQMNLSEIADEFGFTDESHFCKQFRKYSGVTPTEFRNVKFGL